MTNHIQESIVMVGGIPIGKYWKGGLGLIRWAFVLIGLYVY